MQSLQKRIKSVLPTLNEYQRRNYLAAEADAIGYGGSSLVSRISRVSRKTVDRGIRELKDPAAFAVESIRIWWYCEGIADYATADEIVITADCGGSNGNRNRLWKCELQNLANEMDKPIRVLHYPPGCSK